MAKYQCPVCGRPSQSQEGCFYHKPRKPIARSAPAPKTSKFSHHNTEEDDGRMAALFQEIWDAQSIPRRCWACNAKIWGPISTVYFDHLLEKSVYAWLKYEKENIFFCCGDCHTKKGDGAPHPVHAQAIEEAKKRFL